MNHGLENATTVQKRKSLLSLDYFKIRSVLSFNVTFYYNTASKYILSDISMYIYNVSLECVITVNVEALILIVHSFNNPVQF
jgi:hypothetical protein